MATALERGQLEKVVRTASKMIGCDLSSIYVTRYQTQDTDSSHPASSLFKSFSPEEDSRDLGVGHFASGLAHIVSLNSDAQALVVVEQAFANKHFKTTVAAQSTLGLFYIMYF